MSGRGRNQWAISSSDLNTGANSSRSRYWKRRRGWEGEEKRRGKEGKGKDKGEGGGRGVKRRKWESRKKEKGEKRKGEIGKEGKEREKKKRKTRRKREERKERREKRKKKKRRGRKRRREEKKAEGKEWHNTNQCHRTVSHDPTLLRRPNTVGISLRSIGLMPGIFGSWKKTGFNNPQDCW